jgi:hypothetical protein
MNMINYEKKIIKIYVTNLLKDLWDLENYNTKYIL